jgi:hypothetical protein
MEVALPQKSFALPGPGQGFISVALIAEQLKFKRTRDCVLTLPSEGTFS